MMPLFVINVLIYINIKTTLAKLLIKTRLAEDIRDTNATLAKIITNSTKTIGLENIMQERVLTHIKLILFISRFGVMIITNFGLTNVNPKQFLIASIFIMEFSARNVYWNLFQWIINDLATSFY